MARACTWLARAPLLVLALAGAAAITSMWVSVTIFWYPPAGVTGRGVHAWLGSGSLGVAVVDWSSAQGVGPRTVLVTRNMPEPLRPRLDLGIGQRSIARTGVGPPFAFIFPLIIVLAPAGTWAGVRLWQSQRRRPAPGMCPGCGYDGRGLPGATCPECGALQPDPSARAAS